MQLDAYRESVKRLGGLADWVAFIDATNFRSARVTAHCRWSLHSLVPRSARLPSASAYFGVRTIARPQLIVQVDTAHNVKLTTGAYLLTDHTLRAGGLAAPMLD
jgi:hypothetical protein